MLTMAKQRTTQGEPRPLARPNPAATRASTSASLDNSGDGGKQVANAVLMYHREVLLCQWSQRRWLLWTARHHWWLWVAAPRQGSWLHRIAPDDAAGQQHTNNKARASTNTSTNADTHAGDGGTGVTRRVTTRI